MSEFLNLQSINLREIWQDEAKDFTPWLAQKENLSLLSETLNMDLKLQAQEINVGQFRADLLCQNLIDNSLVLIENQLEITDHNHLGQIITYAAGLDATNYIWISSGYTVEHRETLKWLNEISPDKYQFFGVLIEAFKSENSELMAKFYVYSAPAKWIGHLCAVNPVSLSAHKQSEYWSAFCEYLSDKNSPMKPWRMYQTYLTFALGHSGFKLSVMQNGESQHIGVRLYVSGRDARNKYKGLVEKKKSIEKELGISLEWSKSFGKNPCRITLRKEKVDPSNKADWLNQFEWLCMYLEKFDKVFRPRILEI